MENKLVCHHVKHGLWISPQKEFAPCCRYTHSIADNFDDYFNGDELKELKDSFSKGIRHPGCKKCWDQEDNGHPSKRILDQEYVFHGKEPGPGIHTMQLSFGNSCNLACRTCGSDASTTWIKEEKGLIKQGLTLNIHPPQKFYQDSEFLRRVKQESENIKDVSFVGGETFTAGIRAQLDYLDYLIALGSEDIHLHYTTNATIFPNNRFTSRWKKFKRIDIQLSIDGTGKHFEYNRWPALWQPVLDNIKRYQQMAEGQSNIHISIGHVVSVFTVYYFPEFYRWCLQNKFKDPFISLLSFPPKYDIRALPEYVKEGIKEKLSKYHFDSIINYMCQQDLSDQFALGQDFIKALDKQREQSFKETFPEFYQLLIED